MGQQISICCIKPLGWLSSTQWSVIVKPSTWGLRCGDFQSDIANKVFCWITSNSFTTFLEMKCNYCWFTVAHTACKFQAGQEVRIDPQQVWEWRVYDRKNCRKPKKRGKHNSRITVSPDQQNWELPKRNLNCLLHVQNTAGNSAGYWKITPSTSEAVFAPRIYF